jgi:hypothetical protein
MIKGIGINYGDGIASLLLLLFLLLLLLPH